MQDIEIMGMETSRAIPYSVFTGHGGSTMLMAHLSLQTRSDLFMYPTPVYMDDPNVVTWKGGNFLPIMIKAIQQSALPSGFDFGFAYQIAHYDSSKTLRYYRRAAVVF